MAFQTLPKRIEEFAKKVPGLGTYLQREGMRDADKLIRDELAKKLDQVKGTLDGAKRARVDAGSLKNLDKLDRATRKIEKVRDTIKFDSRGYRGLFDPEEVGEAQLLSLLDFDQKLFGVVDALAQSAAQAASLSDADLLPALLNFEKQVEDLDHTLADREQYSKQNLPAGAGPVKA